MVTNTEKVKINSQNYTFVHVTETVDPRVKAAIQELLNKGMTNIILHFHKDLSVDLSFPGLLLKLILLIQKDKGLVQIIIEDSDIYNIITTAGINAIVPVYCRNVQMVQT